MRPVLLSVALVLHAGAASGGEIPDMTGIWVSEETHAVILGSGSHYQGTAGPEPRAGAAVLTLTIDHHDGRRFWGRIVSAEQEEPWLAVFDHTDQAFVAVDSDGHIRGTMLGSDRFENCYTQVAGVKVASCSIFTRQK